MDSVIVEGVWACQMRGSKRPTQSAITEAWGQRVCKSPKKAPRLLEGLVEWVLLPRRGQLLPNAEEASHS